jgi:uncharacterized membrane protein
MPFRKKDVDATAKMAVWSRELFTILLLAAYALVLVSFWWPFALPGKPGWPEAVLLLVAVVSTIAALSRHLPTQNILAAAFIIGLVGGAVNWLDLKTGIPFGLFTPGHIAGPKLFFHKVPWAMPVIWILAILISRGVARLILRPWRKLRAYGFWLMGVTAALAVLFDFALDPFASRVKQYWFWEPTKFPLAWQGAPLVNFFGWAVVALLILAFITPLLINKRHHKNRPPDFHPLGVWCGGALLFGISDVSHGLWLAAAVNVIFGVVVAVFAIRGARW